MNQNNIAAIVILAIILSFASIIVASEMRGDVVDQTESGRIEVQIIEDMSPVSKVLLILSQALICLAGVASMSAFGNSKTRLFLVASLTLMLAWCVGWLVLDLADENIGISRLWVPIISNPIKMFLCIGVFASCNPVVWKYLPRLVNIIAATASILAVYKLVSYGYIPYLNGNCSLLIYLQIAIWFGLASLMWPESQSKTMMIINSMPVVIGIFSALYLTNRSWPIVGVLGIIASYILSRDDKKKTSLHTAIVSIFYSVVLILLTVFIFIVLKPDAFDVLINRLVSDTRSHQYYDLFDSASVHDFLIGSGRYSYYYSTEYNMNTPSIDNQIIYTSWKFGLPVLLGYLAITVIPIFIGFRMKDKRKYMGLVCILVLWLCSNLGLSIFHPIQNNPQNILIILISGRLLYKYQYERQLTNRAFHDHLIPNHNISIG